MQKDNRTENKYPNLGNAWKAFRQTKFTVVVSIQADHADSNGVGGIVLAPKTCRTRISCGW